MGRAALLRQVARELIELRAPGAWRCRGGRPARPRPTSKDTRMADLWRAAAGGVHGAEHDARSGVSLQRCFAEPRERRGIILRYSFAVQINIGKAELRLRLTDFRSLAIPACRSSVILGDAAAVGVQVAEIHCGRRVAATRSLCKEAQGFREILGYAATFEVQDAQIVISRRVAAVGGSVQPVESGAGVGSWAPAREVTARFTMAAGRPWRASR